MKELYNCTPKNKKDKTVTRWGKVLRKRVGPGSSKTHRSGSLLQPFFFFLQPFRRSPLGGSWTQETVPSLHSCDLTSSVFDEFPHPPPPSKGLRHLPYTKPPGTSSLLFGTRVYLGVCVVTPTSLQSLRFPLIDSWNRNDWCF